MSFRSALVCFLTAVFAAPPSFTALAQTALPTIQVGAHRAAPAARSHASAPGRPVHAPPQPPRASPIVAAIARPA
ncbi:MAG: hypothetical protein WA156_18055, partial [Methylocystis silviterrae]